MEIHSFTVPVKSRTEKFHLLPLGDIHWGNISCDDEFVQDIVDWAAKAENVYVIGMGDYVEADHHQLPWHSMEKVQKQIMSDEQKGKLKHTVVSMGEQFRKIKFLFKPLADRGRLIGMHAGNHDNRLVNLTGYNLVAEMCADFGVKFLDHSALTRLVFARGREKVSWDVFSTHGKYRGSTAGGKLTKLSRMSEIADADVYLHGDTHDLINYQHPVSRLNWKGFYEERNKVYAHTGSFLRTRIVGQRTYSEEHDYKGVSIGCPKLTFIPRAKVVRIATYMTEEFEEV